MSTSTDAFDAAFDAYLTNAGYEENESYSECVAFITACNKLLVLLPAQAGTGRNRINMEPERIKEAKEEARAWASANKPTSSSGKGSVQEFGIADSFYGR